MRGIACNSLEPASSVEIAASIPNGVEAGWRRGGREEELYGDYDQVDYAQVTHLPAPN